MLNAFLLDPVPNHHKSTYQRTSMGQRGEGSSSAIIAVMADSVVTFSGPVTMGVITEPASAVPVDLAPNGYLEDEFLAAGMACGYDAGDDAPADGHWPSRAGADTAPYRTRVVVRRPADSDRFSGVLLVEWLNVSSGFEADPDWAYLHEEIFRAGHAYAGVSAQAVGVIGGTARLALDDQPAPGLVGTNPERYGSLHHPGDRYSFEIFRQIGHALRGAVPDRLLGLRPTAVVAIGESQSAMYLTSYINAVHPLSPVFDGFLVHSRGAGAAALTGEPIDPPSVTTGVRIRTDSTTPVLVLEAEGDLMPPLAFRIARQPDSNRLRLWEMAGTSHADSYLIGVAADLMGCDWRINEGPHRFIAQAALHALVGWCTAGTPPPSAARIEFSSDHPPVIARDRAGNAVGGVRTPVVDVPLVTLRGDSPPGKADALGWLVGSTTPLPPDDLLRRYGDRAGYLRAFTESLDEATGAGFLLPAHREELLANAIASADEVLPA
jgi:hypothetical protein